MATAPPRRPHGRRVVIPTITSVVVSLLLSKRSLAQHEEERRAMAEQLAKLERIEETLARLEGRALSAQRALEGRARRALSPRAAPPCAPAAAAPPRARRS